MKKITKDDRFFIYDVQSGMVYEVPNTYPLTLGSKNKEFCLAAKVARQFSPEQFTLDIDEDEIVIYDSGSPKRTLLNNIIILKNLKFPLNDDDVIVVEGSYLLVTKKKSISMMYAKKMVKTMLEKNSLKALEKKLQDNDTKTNQFEYHFKKTKREREEMKEQIGNYNTLVENLNQVEGKLKFFKDKVEQYKQNLEKLEAEKLSIVESLDAMRNFRDGLQENIGKEKAYYEKIVELKNEKNILLPSYLRMKKVREMNYEKRKAIEQKKKIIEEKIRKLHEAQSEINDKLSFEIDDGEDRE